jgi:putative ATPase
MDPSFQYHFPGGQTLTLHHGDLTKQSVDAIINAANAYLQHGGGVAAAIVRAGGPEIQTESNAWVRSHGSITHDAPAVTGAGALPCKYVIHVVGPIWGEGDEDSKLSAAICSAMRTADQLGLTSLAIPPISTGIFGFPRQRAARIFFDTILDYFHDHPTSALNDVRLTIIDIPTLNDFAAVYRLWLDQNPEEQH